MSQTLSAAQAKLVERFGILSEQAGMSRIAGRILGLLIQSSGDRSLDEIADMLSVSRASVSTEARRLLDAGIVERVSRPGDRKDYYQISPRHFLHDLEHRLASIQELVRLLEESRRESSDPIVISRLEQSVRAHSQVMDIVSTTIARWREEIGRADTATNTAGSCTSTPKRKPGQQSGQRV